MRGKNPRRFAFGRCFIKEFVVDRNRESSEVVRRDLVGETGRLEAGQETPNRIEFAGMAILVIGVLALLLAP